MKEPLEYSKLYEQASGRTVTTMHLEQISPEHPTRLTISRTSFKATGESESTLLVLGVEELAKLAWWMKDVYKGQED